MGTVKVKVREEHLLHPTVAFTPARLNLGALGLKMWQRPEQPVAQERHRKPLAEQESARWLEGYQLACEVQQSCPDTLVVNIADREGDIHEWCLDAMQRLPGERAEFIIRAKCNRRIAKGKEPRSVWEEMQKAGAAGRLTVELTRQPDRPPRQVTLRVAVKRVTCNGARRPGGRLPPVEVVAVDAKECRAPRGEEPIEWLLLTSLPVADFPSACTVVQWYRCRWEIELFFRVLKQGCQIEQ
jgi:Transposase DDE domain